MNKTIISVLVIIILILGGLFVFWPNVVNDIEHSTGMPVATSTVTNPDQGGMVACTMEAKLCPDGSAVGRSGPNCEFAACPATTGTSSGTVTATQTAADVTLSVGQKGKMGDLMITLNSITGDNRCPTDVVCIVAGSVTANVTLTDPANTSTTSMSSSGSTYHFNNYDVSITAVAPDKQSQKSIAQNEYRLTFHIKQSVK